MPASTTTNAVGGGVPAAAAGRPTETTKPQTSTAATTSARPSDLVGPHIALQARRRRSSFLTGLGRASWAGRRFGPRGWGRGTHLRSHRRHQRVGDLAVDAKAKALKAAGENVIGFGAGEPDFPTPEPIVAAAIAAASEARYHHYSPTAGLPELRAAIAHKTKRDSGFDCAAEQVLVTNGGKHAVYNTFQVLCDPGDEVLLPAPYWTSYPGDHHARRRRPGGAPDHRGHRVPGVDRAARGRGHAAHEGAAVRVAEQPDRRGLSARGGRGDRAVGASSAASGS